MCDMFKNCRLDTELKGATQGLHFLRTRVCHKVMLSTQKVRLPTVAKQATRSACKYLAVSQSHVSHKHPKLSNHSRNKGQGLQLLYAWLCHEVVPNTRSFDSCHSTKEAFVSLIVPWPAELQSMHRQHAKHHTPRSKPMGKGTCQSAVHLKQHSMRASTHCTVKTSQCISQCQAFHVGRPGTIQYNPVSHVSACWLTGLGLGTPGRYLAKHLAGTPVNC